MLSNNKKKLIKSLILIVIFCTITYFPFFLHLGSMPIIIWDEARLAINAYEMNLNNNYIVTHFCGEPDMWNTKPPLLIWLQVFFIKLLGVNELAIRLPSAIAAFLTAALLLIFSIKYIKDTNFGFIAVLFLITSNGYVHLHAARTGDYDALLTLFTTLYPLMFFLYLEKNNEKYLHWCFVALTLGVLTKTVQALFFVPAIFLYVLFTKKLVKTLKDKWFYIDILISLIIILGYYLLREHFNPGYLKAVWQNDLGQRYLTPIDGHRESFLYYYDIIVDFHLKNWYWLLPCGFVAGIFIKNEKIRKISIYSSILIVTYWLIISLSQTKLQWYIVPMFPFMAILCSVIIYFVFSVLKESKTVNKHFIINVIPYIFIFLVFLTPYSNTIDKVYFPQQKVLERDFYNISFYLQHAAKDKFSLKNQKICYEGYNAHLLFYTNLLNEKGENVTFADVSLLQQGDTVIASQKEIQDSIENNFEFSEIKNQENVKTYVINGKKSNN